MSVQAAEGVDFSDGVPKEDYGIFVESEKSSIESLTANQIDFRPPLRAPALDQRFRHNNMSTLDCHRHDSFHVQVRGDNFPLSQLITGARQRNTV